jgi:hypothetical protein
MYEHRSQPPISRMAFVVRMVRHFIVAVALVAISLGVGMLGYLYFEPEKMRTWHDAFLNASMLLGGMGPVDPPQHEGGKIFAGLYALYAGLVFLVAAGLLLAPLFHRLLHQFHWDQSGRMSTPSSPSSHGPQRAA